MIQHVRADKEPSTANLGKKIDNVSFTDENGKAISLHDLKDKKAIVVVFLSFDCPVPTATPSRWPTWRKEYGKHGVAFLGLTVNEDETPPRSPSTPRFQAPVPRLQGRQAGRRRRPQGRSHARGVRARPQLRAALPRPDRRRLRRPAQEEPAGRPSTTCSKALDELLAGKAGGEPATQAVGCPIPREQGGRQGDGKVTYHRDVLPILQNHCQECHRPGEVGPFSLMTYRQAVNWADDIKELHAVRARCRRGSRSRASAFHNERRLTDKEIATLAAWVDGGTPEGDPKDAPPPRSSPTAGSSASPTWS